MTCNTMIRDAEFYTDYGRKSWSGPIQESPKHVSFTNDIYMNSILVDD